MALNELLLKMRVEGWCILESVIPPDVVADVRESVLSTVEKIGSRSSFAPSGVQVIAGLINHNQSFAPYLVDEHLVELITALLGAHFRVSFTTALVNDPGSDRGQWHADWPYIQTLGARLPAPYPDVVTHVTTLFMLSDFTPETGATYVLPESHRASTNPTADIGVDRYCRVPGEVQACGEAGSVMVLDSRLWHAAAPNRSGDPRSAVGVRFAPWWLNLEVLRPNSFQRRQIVEHNGKPDGPVPSVPRHVYHRLPIEVQPLFHHWIERETDEGESESPSMIEM